MSRVKVHKHQKGYKLNSAEREMARRGKKFAVGTVVALVVLITTLFLYVQFGH
jgi:hypothetical protein